MVPEDDSLGPLGAQPLGVFVRGGDHGFFNEAFRGEHVRVWARDGLSVLVPVNRDFGRHGEDDGARPAACFPERVRALAKGLEFAVAVLEALLGFFVGDRPLDPHPGRTHRLPGDGPSVPIHVDDGEQGALRFLARERARVLAQDLRVWLSECRFDCHDRPWLLVYPLLGPTFRLFSSPFVPFECSIDCHNSAVSTVTPQFSPFTASTIVVRARTIRRRSETLRSVGDDRWNSRFASAPTSAWSMAGKVDVIVLGNARRLAPAGEAWTTWFDSPAFRKTSWRSAISRAIRSDRHCSRPCVSVRRARPCGVRLRRIGRYRACSSRAATGRCGCLGARGCGGAPR